MNPTVVAVVSDTHIGSSTALSLPKFTNDDDQLVMASEAQKWILECWNDYWAHVYAVVKRNHARLVVLHLGDVIDGNHHGTTQILPNVEDQRRMAHELLEPIAHKAAKMIFTRGTSTHVGEAAREEVGLATALGAEIYWEGLIRIGKLVLDVAHHPGIMNAETIARNAQFTAMEEGNPIPRYVLRGDKHVIRDSGVIVRDTRAIILPSWQLRTGFGYRVASGKRSDIGGLIILPDGELDTSRLRYQAAGKNTRKVIEA